MLRVLGGLLGGKPKEHVIDKYTRDLTAVTFTIHELDKRLKRNDEVLMRWQHRLKIYGTTLVVLFGAMAYSNYRSLPVTGLTFLLGLLAILGLSRLLCKVFEYQRRNIVIKLDKARAQHQGTLEDLKKATNFYSTHSLIQRFSSGPLQSQDASTLMDEELQSKYDELQNLQKELAQLRGDSSGKSTNEAREETDRWFDKVLDVLSGGGFAIENNLVPVTCRKCAKTSGCYVVRNTEWTYVCPHCGEQQTNSAEPEGTTSRSPSGDMKDKNSTT
ncbi:AER167Wp [Eremothecium gossypii ATCC 10895]|uniref:Endoplasmic reticulum junction formation protein lunapark n=1 Tax=Eremothecium gossypii (strain ATCC 10895 / CBS 109.51 / FGSC 9923 / NRRL Y-1056) TaxID=284811 RepID=Q756T6_EREGS|nr:AER167Wp [Eremothecium gossypii ATCC 10895]AAS52849.1 AER167Wp [Eremothecium gossypii ATCC 10895]AEY97156.1 FAER167Wp [Eremothecium gossypii FDAG1]